MKDRLIPQDDVIALVHSAEYANWVLGETHPTQCRYYQEQLRRKRTLQRSICNRDFIPAHRTHHFVD